MIKSNKMWIEAGREWLEDLCTLIPRKTQCYLCKTNPALDIHILSDDRKVPICLECLKKDKRDA